MVFALAAFAAPKLRADIVFSRDTVTAERWAHYSATYTAPFTGNYTFGFNLTAGGSSGDNAILVDAVQVTNGATNVFADGFETPDLASNTGNSANGGTATIGNWVFSNFSGVLDGSPPNWGLAAQGLGSADGTTQYAYLQAVNGTLGKIKAVNTLALVAGQTYTISFDQASRRDFGGTTSYAVTLDFVPPTVYASGISGVTTWDPIYPAVAFPNWPALGTTVQTAGPLPNDPNWVNPHAAFVFPDHTHPWAPLGGSSPYNFDARWINAWSNIISQGPSGQSWTKYSTTVFGEGDFVLQFLADNLSWIYLDGTIVGNQDDNWQTNGTGRYTIHMTGAGAHELVFIIFDGGGAAGGKFRFETKASFLANNPGATLPPAPATITLSNLTQTYDGTPKSVTVTTAPSGLTPTVTYNGSTTAPTATGTYTVVAKVSSPDYLGSASGTLTITQARVDFTFGNLAQTYDGSAKSVTVTPVPSNVAYVINYLGDRTNAGTCPVQVVSNNPNYSGSKMDTLVIAKANATVSVSGYTGVYDGAEHGAKGSAAGVAGNSLAGLDLGGSFTDAPGGTAHWTFTGGANYNDQSGDAAIVINKADATVSVSGYSGTYDGVAHGATGTATGIGRANLGGLDLGASFTDAPGGTAHWSFAGGTNYNDQSGDVAIVIAKANASVVVTPYSVTYDAVAHSATVASISGVNGETGATVGAVTLNTTHTDAGAYSDSWSFTGGANYNDIAATTISDKIAKANATVSVSGYSGIYDTAAHGATGTATGVGGVNLNGSLDLGLAFTDAPGGTANWKFSGGTNYNDASGTAVIAIAKANAAITVNGYTGIYDGSAHGTTGTAKGVGGVDLSAGLDLGASFTNVPGGTATWKFSGGTNYNDASATAAIVINKANPTVVVTPYNVEFDGHAHSASVASIVGVNGETGATVGTVTLNSTHTSVGTYADSWTFAATGNYNNIGSTPITDVIKDTTPPVIASVTPSSATLWPPNHQMVPITVSVAASDLVGVTSLKIISVTSSEPDNGLGDGDTAGDIQITGNLTVNLRAERSGNGDGRTYTITVQAADAAGNLSTPKTCTVSVPKSQGKGK
ncbi:MAG TPA: MBG domain-containing protein [Opitutaceae bacterium]|nr:MBG domain-containing protein [Opitutaceae bacterium]